MTEESDIWFDYLSASERIAVAEEMLLPPPDLAEIAPGVFGYTGIGVVCAGCNVKQMRRVVEKLRADKLDVIGARLPIWC